ncbi:MAG: hypothetical protein ABR903_04815 [Thermodesulfovibrionales bacterium]
MVVDLSREWFLSTVYLVPVCNLLRIAIVFLYMNRWIGNLRVSALLGMPPFIGISVALSRIISLSSCNVLFGFIVYIFEKGDDKMNPWVKNLKVVFFLLVMIVAGGVCYSQAADFDHRSGDDLKRISSLISMQSGSAMKTARQRIALITNTRSLLMVHVDFEEHPFEAKGEKRRI